MAVTAGGVATVRVTVATLWSSPEALRPADRAALGPAPDIPAWVAGMTATERLDSPVLSQLPLGEPVLVEEVRADRWARVVALEQPAASRDERGYPGWLPAEQLWSPAGGSAETSAAAGGDAGAVSPRGAETSADTGGAGAPPGGGGVDASATGGRRSPAVDDGRWLVVDAPVTDLRASPKGRVALPGVVLGTRLLRTGPPDGEWCPVAVPGHPKPLWVDADDVGALPTGRECVVPSALEPAGQTAVAGVPSSASEALGLAALSVARRLTGVPYVWGGVSVHGIDCSGLVRLAWRRLGVTLPRDAADQAAALADVPLGHERPGDLYFFARPGRPIHHVGIVSGPGRMLHASYAGGLVVEEALPDARAATLVAARRVISVLDVD